MKFCLVGVLVIGTCGGGAVGKLFGQPPKFLIAKNATWKYSVGKTPAAADWKETAFNDSQWKAGRAGFGYGDSDDVTVLGDMRGRYTAVFIRGAFEIGQLDGLGSLHLYVNFDDGFIAYLNGKQVAAASVKQEAGRVTALDHEAGGFEEFVIHDARRLLVAGRNVLAIEGHNVGPESSDFSLDPFLATGKVEAGKSSGRVADFLADVDELERRLLDQSSYLTRRGFDYQSALARLRESITPQMQLDDFALALRKLVMQIGDCHAQVQWSESAASAWLPLRPADTADGLAALGINMDQPLDVECPYLESIDGVALPTWLGAAASYVPCGSAQLVRRRSLDQMGRAGVIRNELKLPASETVTIGLRSADGAKHTSKRLRLTRQRYAVPSVGPKESRMLDEQIGYLRIRLMDDRLIESIVEQVKKFRDTKGMIIDVRDNTGGNYGITRAIYGFFVPDDAKPHVTNIAVYRLSASFAKNHIEYRPTYRADWEGWNDQELAAIRQAAAGFRPEWTPPEGKFSEWHYLILSRERNGRGGGLRRVFGEQPRSDYFYYDKPVVVLCNAASFSATDGFLNALADLPQVTLVGESSGGGSGAQRSFQLPRTQIGVVLSSMASFRPNGRLFDGNGIEVDIPVKPTLADFTSGEDSVLARAIAVINERSK